MGTLSLTNYSKLNNMDANIPMPETLQDESPKAASKSALLNQAILYSEGSIH